MPIVNRTRTVFPSDLESPEEFSLYLHLILSLVFYFITLYVKVFLKWFVIDCVVIQDL